MDKDKGNTVLNDCNVSDVVEHFGEKCLLDNISDVTIADYIESNTNILNNIDDSILANAIFFKGDLLSEIGDGVIIEYLENIDYKVIDLREEEKKDDMLRAVTFICRQLKPKGYIDKEDAKELICQYIDQNMIKSLKNE